MTDDILVVRSPDAARPPPYPSPGVPAEGANATRRPRGNRLRRLLKRCAIAAIVLPLLAFALFEIAVRALPYPTGLDRPPSSSTLVVDRDGKPLAAFAAADGRWHLPLADDQVSPHLLAAVVAVEDARFHDHAGVDWLGAAGAVRDNVSAGGVRRGASTLTMQLHRLRDPRRRGFLAKLDQAVRARQIERLTSKWQILIEYVNRAPFGGALVGAGSASWRYFGKPCADLSLGEAALLAGLPQNPNAFRPDRHPDAARRRRSHVLRRMLDTGAITAEQLKDADAEPLTATWRPLPQDRAAGAPAADGALATLLAIKSSKPTGGTIVATLDARTQQLAAAITSDHLKTLAPSGVSAAALVALDTDTGRCLASVSLEWKDGRAVASRLDLTRRPRSTGSVLKPFIYAAAFDAGIVTPNTIVRDEPSAWPAYVPGNYDKSFAGELSAADALARSRNIPALVLLEQVGVSRALGVLESAGVATPARSPRPVGLSLAVGGAEATPTEVAQAFATLARGGIARPATLVASADDLAHDAIGCLRPSACAQAMRSLAAADRAAGVCPEAVRANVAWKTGTSSGHRDAWCAAATPNVTVVVWLGNPAGGASPVLIGQEAAAPLALRLTAALDRSPRPWPAVDAEAVAPRPSTTRTTRSTVDAAARLVIVSPQADAVVVVDPDLPPDRQKVALQSAWHRSGGGGGAAPTDVPVWWFVDGTLVGTGTSGEKLWWTPAAGEHEVRVSDERGRSAKVQIRVLAPTPR